MFADSDDKNRLYKQNFNLTNQSTNGQDLVTPLRFTTLHEYNQLVELLKTTTAFFKSRVIVLRQKAIQQHQFL